MFSLPVSLPALLLNRFLWKLVAAVVALVAAYGAGYSRGYDKGFAAAEKKAQAIIQQITLERDSWKHDYEALQAEVKAKAKAWAAAMAEQKAAGEEIISNLTIKLERYRREAVKLRGELSDTRKFVSVVADANCVVPVGFVWMHNAAASGSSASIPAATAPSTAVNADAPSGVTLSQVAETAAYNYALSLEWRSQLIAWQDWYGQWQAWYAEWTARQKALDKPPPGR